MKLYDTKQRTLIDFKPSNGDTARMYVCGVTVYDRCHLGHGRAYVAFDVIRRYLEFSGTKVKMVRNVTDIDDKIINKARALAPDETDPEKIKNSCLEITQKFYQSFLDNMKALNVRPGTIEPKATEHIPEIIGLIENLIKNGHAYTTEDGVYFRVESFNKYGSLSGRNLDDLKSGARVDVNEAKESPLDFALWKLKKEKEPFWPSPWGDGRPGWHIECSAMALKHLGPEVDIHGGGEDLVFPHHENEIAQAEAATGKTFVRHWIHNGFVKIDDEKMSKSLNNFLTLEDTFKKYPPRVVRFFFVSKHYRSPIDFTEKGLIDSTHALERIDQCLRSLMSKLGSGFNPETAPDVMRTRTEMQKFMQMMDDDANTSGALGAMFDLITEINKSLTDEGAEIETLKKQADALFTMCSILGIAQAVEAENKISIGEAQELSESDIDNILASGSSISDGDVEKLIRARLASKQAKNWAMADKLRDTLKNCGIEIKDAKDSCSWLRR